MYAAQGWDSVTIDMQHGAGNINDAVAMLVAIQSAGDATPLVRVPWNDPGQIMRALDAGAMGIICPMINTKAEAEALVRAGRYPPMGERSFGPYRASQYGADYWQKANEEVLLFAMVETRPPSTTSRRFFPSRASAASTSARPTCRSASASRRRWTPPTRRCWRRSTPSSRPRASGA